MPHRFAKWSLAVAVTISIASPANAVPSTSRGLISVAQVVQMLDKAPTEKTAQQLLTAYLAGVGEAAGTLVSKSGASCRTSLSLSVAHVRQALGAAATGRDSGEVPATPFIVRDMLDRAGCVH